MILYLFFSFLSLFFFCIAYFPRNVLTSLCPVAFNLLSRDCLKIFRDIAHDSTSEETDKCDCDSTEDDNLSTVHVRNDRHALIKYDRTGKVH